MKNISHVVEHTPIYDIDAYQQRQNRQKIIYNILQTLTYLCAVGVTFSLLLWGGVA